MQYIIVQRDRKDKRVISDLNTKDFNRRVNVRKEAEADFFSHAEIVVYFGESPPSRCGKEGAIECRFIIDVIYKSNRFAIRIRKNRLTPEKLCQAIEMLLSNPEARRKAQDFQQIMQKWDDPAIITEFFENTFGTAP